MHNPNPHPPLTPELLEELLPYLEARGTSYGTATARRRGGPAYRNEPRRFAMRLRVGSIEEGEALKARAGGRLRQADTPEHHTSLTFTGARAEEIAGALWDRLSPDVQERAREAVECARERRARERRTH